MRTTNSQMSEVVKALQSGNAPKPNTRSIKLNAETMKLVTLLFTRLGDLFGNKCQIKGLVIFKSEAYQQEGLYSDMFTLWCRKLNGLTSKQIAFGMTRIEQLIAEKYRDGEEMWPPSYAEFIGLCNEHWESQAHKPFDKSRALEDITAKEKRFKLGRQKCSELLDLFGD